jgi:glycosyltransferase involved in cell wall biosynthesis
MKKLKIAHVAPLFESVPPSLYGGTERVVSFLTEELVALGHDVTLFASGDSRTNARLVPVCERSLRLDKNCVDPLAYHIVQLQMVKEMRDEFDIIHYHTDYLHFPLSRGTDNHVTTLHGRLDIRELEAVYKVFADSPVISISQNQRKPLPNINWIGNVYHGLPEDLFTPKFSEGKYLAFLGRVSREKGLDNAIAIAKQSRMPLKVAAKIDKADQEYYETQIKHLFDDPLVEYVGEIDEKGKEEFLGNARALLFPIEWSEPFGLVLIESMACGTPVIAFNKGSVPEIIQQNINGFLTTTVEEAVDCVHKIDTVSRANCRGVFEERFTSAAMASAYLEIYHEHLISKSNGVEV